MAINRRVHPGECVRCGLLYQTDETQYKTPELCTWCAGLVIVDKNTGIWREKGAIDADHPKE